MANQAELNLAHDLSERKKILVAQGALFRTGIGFSRNVVQANLHAESLAKSALSHIVMSAYNALKTGAVFKSSNVQMVLPLVLGAVSTLSKKSLLKPVLGGVVALGVVGTIVRFVMQRKKTRRSQLEG